jgi:hypothetical protein
MAKFFTIDGIEDDKFPPEHPDVVKFFDRRSAETILKLFKEYCGLPEDCNVAEHDA